MSSKNRGFVINHQRVHLELDFAGHIKGTTWLTIRPIEARLQAIYLHAGEALTISSVFLSADAPDALPELPASFVHVDPLASALSDLDSNKLVDQHPDYKRRLWTSMAEREEGELCVDVRRGWVRLPELREGQSVRELAEFVVRIEYEVEMKDVVGEGVVFRRPGDNGLTDRIPHIFLNSSSHSSARQWVPCVDSPWARHTWELEIVAPTYLQRIGDREDADILGESSSGSRRIIGEDRIIVVASGELEEQITHPDSPNNTIWYYLQTSPLSVQHVTFAAGPFVTHHIASTSPSRTDADQDFDQDPHADVDTHEGIRGGEDIQPLMLAFSLPGYEVELSHTTACMRQAMDFYVASYGSYPFSSFKMVFVEDPSPQCTVAGTVAVLSTELLYPPEATEQAYISRPILTLALATQWVGVNVVPRTYSDTWLTVGLSMYMNAMFLRSLLGNNEYRFKLRSDIERCVALDRGEQYPLQIPGDQEPPDEARASFIALKAPLVLHILDRRLAKVGTSLGLARIIPKLFLDSLSGDMTNNMLYTNYFLRTCKKASGVDLSGFHEEWIAGSGCPVIKISAAYKHGSGLTLNVKHGTPPAYRAINKYQTKALPWKKPTQAFEGTLTIRIHEGEDPPAEHVIDIEPGTSTTELPYHTKDRRYRGRPGPRPNAARRYAALQKQDVAGDQAPLEPTIDVDGPDERAWRLHDFSEMERSAAEKETGFDWLSFDPDCEWICNVEYDQSTPKFAGLDTTNMLFWASQLRFDRDVIGQRVAIDRLARFSSPLVSSILTRTVRDDSYYFRIRMQAAEALTKLHIVHGEDCPSLGAFHILKIYQADYCAPPPPGVLQDVFPELKTVRAQYTANPPDAENVEDQLIYKAICSAVADIRFEKSGDGGVYSQTLVRNILISILDLAQPEGTNVSPSFTIASVIVGLSKYFPDAAVAPRNMTMTPLVRAVEMIQRWLSLDKLVPSYGNVITIAGLQTLLAARAVWRKGAEPISAAVPYFLPYTREGNNVALRKVALDCVVMCQPLASWLTRYLMRVVKEDSSLSMRRYAADTLGRCWLLRLAIGEVPGLHEIKVNVIEGGQTKDTVAKSMEANARKDVGAMRKLLSDVAFIRADLNQLLAHPGVGVGPLLSVLQAAELMISAVPAKIRLSMSAPAQQSRGLTLRIPGNAVKSGQAPSSDSIGLQPNETKALKLILRRLQEVHELQWFLRPVPRDDTAPGYHDLIKKPMDLSRIEQKLLHSAYTNRYEFRADVKLIVRNAKEYNRVGELVYVAAEELDARFEKQWLQFEKLFGLKPIRPQTEGPTQSTPIRTIPPVTLRLPAAPSAEANPSVPTIKLKEARPNPSVPTIKLKAPSAVRFADTTPQAGSSTASEARTAAPPQPKASSNSKKTEGLARVKGGVKRERAPDDDAFDDELLSMADGPIKKVKLKPKAAESEQSEPVAKKQKQLAEGAQEKKPKGPKPSQSRAETGSPGVAGPSNGGQDRVPPIAVPKIGIIKLNAKPSGSQIARPPDLPLASAGDMAPVQASLPSPLPLYSAEWENLRNQATPYRHLRVKKFLHGLIQNPDFGGIFNSAVTDDIAPGYSKEIAHPIDLSVISAKAEAGQYTTMGRLYADLKLVVGNCRQYNGASMELYSGALEMKLLAAWPALSNPAPDAIEIGKISAWISKSIKGNGVWFATPVDETILPTYYDRIPRENARDFNNIQHKLTSNVYKTYDELDADVYQLCKNATIFNPATSDAHVLAVKIRDSYEVLRRGWEASFRPKAGWL